MNTRLRILLSKRNFSESDIHELRITLKKWNAFFKLLWLAGIKKKKVKRINQSLRPIFKAAGEIRKYQLILKNKKSTISRRESANIKHKIHMFHDELKTEIGRFGYKAFTSCVMNFMCKISPKMNDAFKTQLRVFVKRELSSIEKLVLKDNTKSMHFARIRIRRMIDLSGLINFISDANFLSCLKSVRQKLGRWHDEVDYLHYLKQKNPLEGAEIKTELISEMMALFHSQQSLKWEVRNIFHNLTFLF